MLLSSELPVNLLCTIYVSVWHWLSRPFTSGAGSKHTQIRHRAGREGQSRHWSWLDQREITVSGGVLSLTEGGCFLKSQEESQKLGGFFSQARKLRAGSDLWAMTNNVLNPDPRHCALWARDGILGENIRTSSAPSKIWAGKIRLGKVWRRWDLPSQQWKQVSYLLLPCCSLLFSSIYSDSG